MDFTNSPNFITGLNGPIGLAIQDNNLYVVNWGSNTPGTNISLYNATNGELINENFIQNLHAPWGISIYNEDVYVTNNGYYTPGTTVGKYNASTGETINSEFINNINGPVGICVNNNNLYVANAGYTINGNYNPGNSVGLYNATTGETIKNPFLTGPYSPQCIAVSENNIYVSYYASNINGDTIPGSIIKYDINTGNPIDINFITGLQGAEGIAIKDEYLYVANSPSNTISQYNKYTGELINNNFITDLNYPIGLTIGNNYLFISNYGSNSIGKYSLSTPCFNENTNILTNKGYIPIQNLKTGDYVLTYKHGYKKIELIGTNKFINNPNDPNNCMYKMEKTPENDLLDDLILTGGHSILIDDIQNYGEIQGKLNIFENGIAKVEDKYMVLCYLHKNFTKIENSNIFTYYHFVLENEDDNDKFFGVWANGQLTETMSKKRFLAYNFTLL